MADRLRVLVIPGMFPRFRGDAYGVFVYDYIAAVASAVDCVVVAAQLRGPPGVRVDRERGVTIHRFSMAPARAPAFLKPVLYALWLARTARYVRRLGQFDIIHTHRVAPEGLLACLIGSRFGAVVAVSVHTGPFSKLLRGPLLRLVTRWVLERADAVLPVSADQKRDILKAGIRPRQVFVTFNPVDTEVFELHRDRQPTSKQILFAGRLEPYKGALRVLRAFQEIHHRHPGWTLKILGDGPERPALTELLARDPAVAGKVRLAGAFGKPGFAEEARSSAFFVLPSEHETFGIVIAEAMSAGLPVIVGDRTAPVEFVDETTGIFVAPEDIAGIGRAMEYLIDHLHRYDRDRIRSTVVDRFGLTAFGRRLEETYSTLIRGRATASQEQSVAQRTSVTEQASP